MKKLRFNGLLINALESADVDKLLETLEGEHLVIPDEIDGIRVEGLANYCFYNLKTIKDITFPKGLIFVPDFSITNCTMQRLIFKKNLERIEFNNFRTNKNLNVIEIENGCEFYSTIKGNVYSADKATLIYGFNNHIAESTIRIEAGAFKSSNIETINLPENVSTIGDSAFYNCERLYDVRFNGDNLAWIGEFTFGICSSLKRIEIPKSVSTIDFSAFKGSSLEQLSLEKRDIDGPKLKIRGKAFMNTSLNAVDFSKVPHLTVEDEAFWGTTIQSLSLSGNVSIKHLAFGNCNIEKLSLKSIDVNIPTLKTMCGPLGCNSLGIVELMSKHNNRNDEAIYILHDNAWIEDLYW